jgi:hypothetical protein
MPDVTVTADPASNAVRVAGSPAGRRRAADLLAALDRPVPQTVTEVTVYRLPAGFTGTVGLTIPPGPGVSSPVAESSWTLSGRETRLVTAAARLQGQVVGRGRLVLPDNQTGMLDLSGGAIVRVTPKPAANGAGPGMQLDLTTGRGASTAVYRTFSLLSTGQTLAVLGHDGPWELLVLISLDRVNP